MYEYDSAAAEESVASANNAVSSLQSVPADMNSAASLAASVQVSGLEFLSDGSYASTIEIISNYPGIIIGMISQAERDMIIECVQNGDMSRLVQYVNENKISTQALIEYSKEYMLDIMNSGNIDSYSIGFAQIGGDNARYANLNSALKAQGFSDEFIYNLSNEFCKNNINNDVYYKKEGVVTTAMAFQGMLSLFKLTLGYSFTEYDQPRNGFYFTSGDPNSPVLSAIDCCNYTDWLARCVGIDISGGGVPSKHIYCADGITPSDQILAGKDSEYFKKGEGGDYLIRVVGNEQHIRMIIANDGNGYYYIEDGSTSKIRYESYQSLGDTGYSVTNTDAMFRNTSPTFPNDMIKYDENGNYSYSYKYAYEEQKTQVFANPYWIINQPNINLTQAEQESLLRQYNERNKNPNFTGIELDPSLIYKTSLDQNVDGIPTSMGNGEYSNSSDINGTSPSESHLTAPMGHIDGPEAYETWYDLDMNTVVNNMEKNYGYTNVSASIRSDGVKVISGTAPDGTTFSNLVMVAADVRHDIANPNGTYERGQIVDTTLGKGIVVDACELAIEKRENNQGIHFDLATAWRTEPYASRAYSKDNYGSLNQNVVNVGNKTNSSSNSNTVNAVNVSNSSTPTPNYTYSPSSSGSSSSESTTPNYSSGSSSSSTIVTPPTSNIDTSITNILPTNKFSEALPQLSSGNLGPMEISGSSVSYEVFGVNNSTYGDYVQSLLDNGYVMSSDGSYVKGNYQVFTTITQDGNMSIKLIDISNNSINV